MTNVSVRQKQSAVRTNMSEAITTIDPIGWNRTSTSDISFRLRWVVKLGVKSPYPLNIHFGLISSSRVRLWPHANCGQRIQRTNNDASTDCSWQVQNRPTETHKKGFGSDPKSSLNTNPRNLISWHAEISEGGCVWAKKSDHRSGILYARPGEATYI